VGSGVASICSRHTNTELTGNFTSRFNTSSHRSETPRSCTTGEPISTYDDIVSTSNRSFFDARLRNLRSLDTIRLLRVRSFNTVAGHSALLHQDREKVRARSLRTFFLRASRGESKGSVLTLFPDHVPDLSKSLSTPACSSGLITSPRPTLSGQPTPLKSSTPLSTAARHVAPAPTRSYLPYIAPQSRTAPLPRH
jgi:hypothetical protein